MRYIFLTLSVALGIIAPLHAQEFPYNGIDNSYYFDSPVDMGAELAAATTEDDESLLNTFLAMYDLDAYDGPDKALHYARGIINLILSLASLVVLIWLIYGFYAMFFSGQEEGISRARKIIKMTVIALLLIGLAWLITTFLFYIFYAITS